MVDPYRMIVVNVLASFILAVIISFYKFIFPRKQISLVFLLVTISLLPLISILRRGTYESGDLTLHSVFLMSFLESLKEGIIAPQWSGGLCGSYGCPVFMFEYVLPFYIASIFNFIGFSFIDSIKGLLIFSYISSGLSMYYWAKNEFGKSIYAFVAAVFYLFAPYHLIDMHFRVSVGEVLSFTFIPLIFLFSKKTIEIKEFKYVILNAFSFTLMILAHSSTLIAIMPILLVYTFIVYKKSAKINVYNYISLALSLLIGLSLTAYYWLPAIFEIKYTWYSQLKIGDFKPIFEHIFSPVLFGLLYQGHQGELRLIVGYPHIIIVIISVYLLFRSKVKNYYTQLMFWLISFAVLFVFMMEFTKTFWQTVPLLKTFCMPWRLLVPIAFITSAMAGLTSKIVNRKSFTIIACVLVIGVTILNWGNRKMVPEFKDSYFTHWSLYSEYFEPDKEVFRKSYFDRIALAPELVLDRPKNPIEILNGKANYTQIKRTSISHQYVIRVESDAYIKENTFYFPGWKLKVNNVEQQIIYDNTKYLGVMTFRLKPGIYKVDFEFTDTNVRKISRWVSLITLILIIVFLTKPIVVKIRKRNLLRFLTPKF